MNLLQIQRRRRAANKGFNLIEAAIVLGIVGLVVGGIWVAATSVYANLRAKQATDSLLAITQGVRALYATSSDFGAVVNAGDLTGVLANANVLPGNVGINGSTSATTTNPWSGNVAVVTPNAANATTFGVRFTNLPPAACTDFVMRNAGRGRDAGMRAVVGEANGVPGAAQPAIPAGAATGLLTAGTPMPINIVQNANICDTANAPTARNVVFIFNLKG